MKGALPNVKKKLLIISLTTLLLILIISCSGNPVPENCPELGVITGVDNPSAPLKIENLKGSAIPNFSWQTIDCKSLNTVDNKTLNLSDLRGNPVIIIFHKVMNCPGCAQQMPFIRAAYDQRTNAMLTVLTIYREDKISAVRNFVTSKGYIFTALADQNDEVATKYGFIRGAPITIFVDAAGIIKEYKLGPFQNQEDIEDILKSL
jgi:peroxiredoxin